jgi:hypothetical protein
MTANIRTALMARMGALWCVLRRHDVDWRANANDFPECAGDIVCNTCNKIHWCRWYERRENLR